MLANYREGAKMKYLHGVSVRKGGMGAFPAVPAFVVVLLVRKLWGVEISAEEALALSAFVGGVVAYAKNRWKHGWRGRA
jgi:hypothetical protein